MTDSTVRLELEEASWSISQAQKELAKFDGYNESGREYVVKAAIHDLEIAYQRISRALLINDGVVQKVPR